MAVVFLWLGSPLLASGWCRASSAVAFRRPSRSHSNLPVSTLRWSPVFALPPVAFRRLSASSRLLSAFACAGMSPSQSQSGSSARRVRRWAVWVRARTSSRVHIRVCPCVGSHAAACDCSGARALVRVHPRGLLRGCREGRRGVSVGTGSRVCIRVGLCWCARCRACNCTGVRSFVVGGVGGGQSGSCWLVLRRFCC